MGGDFNVVRNIGEKRNSLTNTSMRIFDELIRELELWDPPIIMLNSRGQISDKFQYVVDWTGF